MASPIRVDEWLEELNRLSSRSVEGFTTKELAVVFGVTERVTRMRLQALMAAGRLRLVGKRSAVALDGKNFSAPVYQLVQESKNGQRGKG
jgi:hypothetical protein